MTYRTGSPAPVLQVLDLSSGTAEELAARLLLQAQVQTNQDHLPTCNATINECSQGHECVLLDRKTCSTCPIEPTATCLDKLTAPSASPKLNITAEVVQPHSPSKATEALQRKARNSHRPIFVKVDVHDPLIILDYENLPFSSPDNAIASLLGEQVSRKQDILLGPNYSLRLNRLSECNHLPAPNYLAMVFADPISSTLNHQLGKNLNTNMKKSSGVAHSRMFDGTTRVYLYSFTNEPMNHDAAHSFCTKLGLALPTIRSLKDMTRIGLFTSVLHDIWLDGSDQKREGVWYSEVFNTNLNRIPWAKTISGYTFKEDCIKARCDWGVNDWPCKKLLPVLCIRERVLHTGIIAKVDFSPETWSRAVKLGHCAPIRNLAKWMHIRHKKHVPGDDNCNQKYLHITIEKKQSNKKTTKPSRQAPNCIFYPPSSYECQRWTLKTLREDLIKARRAQRQQQ